MEVNFSKQLSDSGMQRSTPKEDASSLSSPQDSNDSPHLESEAFPPSPSPPTSSSDHSSESPSSSSDSSPPPPKRSPPPDDSSEAPLALPPLSSDLFEPPPPSHPHSKSPKTPPPSKSPPPPPAKSTDPPPPPPLSFNPPPPIPFHHNPSPPPPPPHQSSKPTSSSSSTTSPPSPPPSPSPSPPPSPPPPTVDSNSHSPPPISPPNNPNQSTPLPISPPPFHVPSLPPNASSILPSPLPNGTPNLSTPTVATPQPNNLQKPFQSTPSTSVEAQSVTERENPSSSRPIIFNNSKNSVKNFSSGAIVGVSIVGVIVLLVVVLFVTSRKKRTKVDGLPNRYHPPNNTKAGAYYSSVGSARSNGHYAPTVSSSHSNIKHANESFRSHRYHSGPQDLVVSKSWFSYDDLMEVTSGFSRDNLLGEGGFGCVYKGQLPDGRCVAVKQLKAGSGQGEREFRAEVEIISRVHHRHLVSLVGYCIAEYHRLLVYEFVPNGTLEQHLHGDNVPIIEWSKRIKIAIGAARGLAYLHEDCHPRIIHRDIKSANILLDYTFEAQVADFGLAKLSNDTYTHVSTRVMGTFGYMAPEYASSGKLTDRSDVFSFGVVLLELITGRKPVDPSQPLGDESLVEWARPRLLHALETQDYEELVDPKMENNYAKVEMFRMIEVAAACIRHSAPKRPRMVQVVRALDFEGDGLDLSNGVKFGHSTIYDSGQYSADIQRFRRTAHGDDEHCTDYEQFGEYEKRSFTHSNRMSNSDLPLRPSSSLLSEENNLEEYYIGYNLETRPINGKSGEKSDNYQ